MRGIKLFRLWSMIMMMFFHTLVSYFQLKYKIEAWKIIINIIKIYLEYEISFLFHYLKDYLMTKLTLG
jgi:hypothetical protein